MTLPMTFLLWSWQLPQGGACSGAGSHWLRLCHGLCEHSLMVERTLGGTLVPGVVTVYAFVFPYWLAKWCGERCGSRSWWTIVCLKTIRLVSWRFFPPQFVSAFFSELARAIPAFGSGQNRKFNFLQSVDDKHGGDALASKCARVHQAFFGYVEMHRVDDKNNNSRWTEMIPHGSEWFQMRQSRHIWRIFSNTTPYCPQMLREKLFSLPARMSWFQTLSYCLGTSRKFTLNLKSVVWNNVQPLSMCVCEMFEDASEN